MKKKLIILSITIIIFASLCFTIIIKSNKASYTLDELVKNADYTVVAKRNVLICEDLGSCYALNAYEGKKAYKTNSKVYTEMYICCSCYQYIGKKIIIVTDGYYFKDEDYYFLFLKCIDKERNLYEPINDKTGIIKLKKDLKPMDSSLKKELNANFSDHQEFWDWFTAMCEEKARKTKEETSQTMQQSVTIVTTANAEKIF